MKVPGPSMAVRLSQNPAVMPAVGACTGVLFAAGCCIWICALIIVIVLVCLLFRQSRKYAIWFAVAFSATTVLTHNSKPRSLSNDYWYFERTYSAEVLQLRRSETVQNAIVTISDSLGSFRCELRTIGVSVPLSVGDIISFRAALRPVEALHEYRGNDRSQRLSAAVSIPAEKVTITSHVRRLQHLPQIWSGKILSAIDRTDISDRTATLLKASLFGRSATESTPASFRGAGLAHLLCVSGFHVALVLSLLSWLLLPLRLWPRYYHHRHLLLIPLIWIFVLSTGAAAPAVRAGVMLTLVLIAQAKERPVLSMNNLFAALFVILLIEPWALFSVSLWLSTVAVAGLIVLSPKLNPFKPSDSTAFKVAQYPAACIAATIATLPIIVTVFHSFPVMGVVAGVLTIPIYPLFISIGLFTAFVSTVGIPAALPTRLTDALSDYLHAVSEYCAELPFSNINHIYLDDFSIVLLSVATVLVVFIVPRLRRIASLSVLSLAIMLAVVSFTRSDSRSRIETVFTDGMAIVNAGDNAVVYIFSTDPTPLERYAAYFRSCGISPDHVSIIRNPYYMDTTLGRISVLYRHTTRSETAAAIYVNTNASNTISALLADMPQLIFLSPSMSVDNRRAIVSAAEHTRSVVIDLGLGSYTAGSDSPLSLR